MKLLRSKHKIGEFAKNLVRARISAGFKTAYQFYFKNGGRRHFPFTFFHYLRVEKGLTLPNPCAVEFILLGLRILPTQTEVRELLMSYLRDILGGGRTADYIINPLFGMTQPENNSAHSVKWIKEHNVVHVTPEQVLAWSASEETFYCAQFLTSDNSAWTGEELAAKLNMAPNRTVRALESLVRAGLIEKNRNGRFLCKQKHMFFPLSSSPEVVEHAAAMKNYVARVSGKDVLESIAFLRSDDGSMANYKSVIADAVFNSGLYATTTDTKGGGFFCVSAKIQKVKSLSEN